jgi:hypothetical protein
MLSLAVVLLQNDSQQERGSQFAVGDENLPKTEVAVECPPIVHVFCEILYLLAAM